MKRGKKDNPSVAEQIFNYLSTTNKLLTEEKVIEKVSKEVFISRHYRDYNKQNVNDYAEMKENIKPKVKRAFKIFTSEKATSSAMHCYQKYNGYYIVKYENRYGIRQKLNSNIYNNQNKLIKLYLKPNKKYNDEQIDRLIKNMITAELGVKYSKKNLKLHYLYIQLFDKIKVVT